LITTNSGRSATARYGPTAISAVNTFTGRWNEAHAVVADRRAVGQRIRTHKHQPSAIWRGVSANEGRAPNVGDARACEVLANHIL
jgi:hypothetical protein